MKGSHDEEITVEAEGIYHRSAGSELPALRTWALCSASNCGIPLPHDSLSFHTFKTALPFLVNYCLC